MQLGLDKDDPIEELLNDSVLAAPVRHSNLLLLHLGILVNRCLDYLCVSGVLSEVRICVR